MLKRYSRFLGILAAVSALLGCSSTTTEPGATVPAPVVTVTGDVAVLAGQTVTFKAGTENGTDSAYSWSSSKKTVATVNDKGVVTGVAAGTAVITATGADTGASGSWGVHVYVEGGTARVVVSGDVRVKVGKTLTLVARTLGGTDASYSWTSSKKAVATVNDKGVVTGVAAGTAVITATGADTGGSGDWGVAVVEEVAPPAPVVTLEGGLSLTVGQTSQLTASTAGGTDTAYTWTSSAEAVATVDENGLVTGVGAGEVVVTATGSDTGAKAQHGMVVIARGIEIPFKDLWSGSGHADEEANAFNHWNKDGEIPTSCARCHSTPGFRDFLGADGTAAGVVDKAAPIGTTIGCTACHNAAAQALTSVTFPSGESVSDLGPESRCMACHQGRESTVSVNDAVTAAAPADDDTVSDKLGFKNVHYFAAGATQFGSQVKGGYEYAGMAYDIKFMHVPGKDTCLGCHDQHTLAVKVAECSKCHTGVAAKEDLKKIRMNGSLADYDGDGDTTEGIAAEIAGLQEKLYPAIQDYAATVIGAPIVYAAGSYPYFFKDTNNNGVADPEEATYANKYDQWTARLVRATYNYQFSMKDPGAFAHNAKYVIELLHDSTNDINSAIANPKVDLGQAARTDTAHFLGTDGPFRHFDADGEVRASCARCHSATGLPLYLEAGGNKAEPVSNGLACSTCHENMATWERRTAKSVTFPSGATVDSGDNGTNLCMSCHQGRESTDSVDEAVAGKDVDTVDTKLGFKNIHYFAAGATRYGAQARGGYQYAGMRYDGLFAHFPGMTLCGDCHDTHKTTLEVGKCGDCHEGVAGKADLSKIRMPGSHNDFDGDGDVTEGIEEEILGVKAKLYDAILGYAKTVAGKEIVYSGGHYPYFFVDKNGNGQPDADETSYGNKYNAWTPRLLKAAYNYQFATKDPGGFAHNAKYVIEIMYDSIADLAQAVTIDMSGMARNDSGHFDPTREAWHHWDAKGAVDAACARCHAPPTGLAIYLDTGANPTEPQPISSGMTCDTCHEDANGNAPRKYVAKVVFPGGKEISNDPAAPDDSFLCMSCHQGRVGKADIDAAIASGKVGFMNVHYLAAGATLYGTQAQVGYEYDGKAYASKFIHFGQKSERCLFCHEVSGDKHAFAPKVTESCTVCHDEATLGDVDSIRKNRAADYDGDGNSTEPLMEEVSGLADLLEVQIQAVAAANGGPIVYAPHSYPYFFKDTNGNGVVDEGEASYGNKYAAWTPALVKAAQNFQLAQKDPGAWAHNTKYIVQLLYDSIGDLGGDVSGLPRP